MTQEEICIITINKNIRNVMEGKALTMPLRKLNRDCRFKKMYFAYCDITEGDLEKAKEKAYRQRPENKAKRKEYHKEYYQRPEVKAKKKAYYLRRKEIKK